MTLRRLLAVWLAASATMAACMILGAIRRGAADTARQRAVCDVCRDLGCGGMRG